MVLSAEPRNHAALLTLASEVALSDPYGWTGLASVATTTGPGTMPPLHVHECDEAYHVVSGRLTLYAGSETVSLGPGDAYVVVAGVPHTHRAEELTRHLTTSQAVSVSRYEDFVRAVARPPALAGDWPDGPDGAMVTALAAANGTTILGAPGELPAT